MGTTPVALLLACGLTAQVQGDFDDFAAVLEELAIQSSMPGMSAAIVHDGEVVWSQGIGLADIENQILAEPDTRYRLASCSKPLASVLVMQLVEKGELTLDAPMNRFWLPSWFAPDPARYADGTILLRHVLSHTSEGTPGESYAYNGNTFADVTFVLEQVTGLSYPQLLQERIFDPAGMRRSAPGHTAPGKRELVELAPSYSWDGQENVRVPFRIMDPDPRIDLTRFNAVTMPDEAIRRRREWLGDGFAHWNAGCSSSGVVSTVLDLAAFDIALDAGRLISAENRETMWTPASTRSGEALPYGLGWFVQEVEGKRVLWHYGWLPPTVSALYVKVPEEKLSFFLLSNSDRLSADMPWTQLGVTASPYARAFLAEFVGK